jgi:DNA-binding LacI/PurR family transcriptional regulator
MARFGASRATVQKALDSLQRDGFVQTEGRKGTFVSDHPPHLTNYGLIFGRRPATDNQWSRFYLAIQNEARSLEESRSISFSTYYGFTPGAGPSDRERLTADIAAQRLAGLIFTFPPGAVEQPAIEGCDSLPVVGIMDATCEKGVATVYTDAVSFQDKALDYLAERGRKRIAIISIPEYRRDVLEHFIAGVNARGMTTGTAYMHGICPCMNARTYARNLVSMMMSSSPEVRPDGLIVSDDNLVEHASAGLVAAGVRVGTDVDVVAHCNFPWPPPSVLPLKRLGFDVRELVRTCVELVDRMNRGEKTPRITRLPAVFEDEAVAGDGVQTAIG